MFLTPTFERREREKNDPLGDVQMSTLKKLFSFPFASSGTVSFPLGFQPDKTITVTEGRYTTTVCARNCGIHSFSKQ